MQAQSQWSWVSVSMVVSSLSQMFALFESAVTTKLD